MATSATGGELLDYIIQTKSLTEAIAVKYLGQVISALQYMHNLGMAHMDIRVSNRIFCTIMEELIFSQRIFYYQVTMSQ